MAGPEFHQTLMGRQYYESTLPKLVEALTRIGTALEKGEQRLKLSTFADLKGFVDRKRQEMQSPTKPEHQVIKESWDNDAIQFPRLLCEVKGVLETRQYRELAESMDLDMHFIDELFDRAEFWWMKIKAHTSNGAYRGPPLFIGELPSTKREKPPHISRVEHQATEEELAQPTLENILAVAEHEYGIPGILFPIDHHGVESTCESEDGRVFISRADQAGMFCSDVDAANFVACLIGKPWKKYFDQLPKPYYYPYFELTLDEVAEIHKKYGTR